MPEQGPLASGERANSLGVVQEGPPSGRASPASGGGIEKQLLAQGKLKSLDHRLAGIRVAGKFVETHLEKIVIDKDNVTELASPQHADEK